MQVREAGRSLPQYAFLPMPRSGCRAGSVNGKCAVIFREDHRPQLLHHYAFRFTNSLHFGAAFERWHRLKSRDADDWTGMLVAPARGTRWCADRWPLGAMSAAAMAATEAFKIVMRKMVKSARDPAIMMETFAPSTDVEFALAPAGTPMASTLGEIDCVSGGAITQSALFALIAPAGGPRARPRVRA